MHDLTDRLLQRAALSGLAIGADLLPPLAAYFELLEHWNEKINLTSLVDPDEAIDRLLLEPIAAARDLPSQGSLIDLGSGGGSPAIPLALALGAVKLVMVESRERKAAFLREAVRHLELSSVAAVETSRFEQLAGRDGFRDSFTLVSIRAVRIDEQTLTAARAFLRPHGLVASFRSPRGPDRPLVTPAGLTFVRKGALLKQSPSQLALFRRVEHS